MLCTAGVFVSLFFARFAKFLSEDFVVTTLIAVAVEAAGLCLLIFIVFFSKTLRSNKELNILSKVTAKL